MIKRNKLFDKWTGRKHLTNVQYIKKRSKKLKGTQKVVIFGISKKDLA